MSGTIQIYYGEGKGKTTAALGLCIREAGFGKSVMIVQFLKGRDCRELDLIKRLEPEIKLFRFEKTDGEFCNLPEDVKEEECMNIKNGLNYVRKVLTTGQCDILVVDELLGLIDYGILSLEEARELLKEKNEDMELILTGRVLPQGLEDMADDIYCINVVKEAENHRKES
ncbi:MAG: cob(I)yrinic acid a,c-diamide adenosyltransferase [Lachnospiraceae bacterium]|nr:cob(I)yrinic acid a,c-diamide adenosyltransferase [Lachnospiraceae bacterium]